MKKLEIFLKAKTELSIFGKTSDLGKNTYGVMDNGN